ncbi:LLM class flavin-dependent oxidoreductase [Phyllobacterium sp. YR531]|uniref:LLM class flavin-dependent oxidoreductase n=1 Tax=Phyllobacterium sp. YR531 TaxID=1144343 RepID=UPI00068A1927|nr:LLM class flavin-dependent oxidoreductase [Phyllobacterium sp. YR531]
MDLSIWIDQQTGEVKDQRKLEKWEQMKLGIIFSVRNHPENPYSLQELYSEYLDDAVYADEVLGFDHLWMNEHHLSPDQWCPSPFTMLAAIAARTKKIRIGTGVLCLPLHNPLRVSEDIAVLDNISGGRFDLGVATGSSSEEFEAFKVPQKEMWRRAWEALDFISRTYSEERVTFEGEFYQYRDVWQNTQPIQKPLPMWWGGFGPNSMKRAAERGFNLLGGNYPGYDDTLLALGQSLDDYQVAQVTAVHVAETREQAWDEAQNGLHWLMNFHRIRHKVPAGMGVNGPLETLPAPEELRNVEGLYFMPGMPIYIGTPDTVREELLADCAGRRGRLTQLALHFRLPGMRTPEVRRSMELFRTEIMPSLR